MEWTTQVDGTDVERSTGIGGTGQADHMGAGTGQADDTGGTSTNTCNMSYAEMFFDKKNATTCNLVNSLEVALGKPCPARQALPC